MIRFLLVAVLATLPACGDDDASQVSGPDARLEEQADDDWKRIEDDALAGVDFEASFGTGNAVWAVGTLIIGDETVVVHHDGETWSRLEGSVSPALGRSIWASGPDDVWLAGPALWHWDGAEWVKLDDTELLEGATLAAKGVWGTGSDDVWVGVRDAEYDDHILHRVAGSWIEVGTLGLMEVIDGCAFAPDDVRVLFDNDHSWELRRWDGEQWTPEDSDSWDTVGAGGYVDDLQCPGDHSWAVVARLGDAVHPSDPLHAGFWVDAFGNGWVVGVDANKRAQIWRQTNGERHETIETGLDGLPHARQDQLRGVWQTASGGVFVFGPDGLVWEHIEAP